MTTLTTTDTLRMAREGMEDNGETVYVQYLDVYRELKAANKYPYNDRFTGLIPAIADLSDHEQESYIYLCQKRRHNEERTARIWQDMDAGAVLLAEGEATRRFERVIFHDYGNSSRREYEGARVLFRRGKVWAILPKGKRSHGKLVSPEFDVVLGLNERPVR